MASMWRRAMLYLGLGPDDEYDDYDVDDEPMPDRRPSPAQTRYPAAPPSRDHEREPEMTSGSVRTIGSPVVRPQASASGADPSERPRTAVVRPLQPVSSAKPHVVAPTSFNHAQEVADKLKELQAALDKWVKETKDLGEVPEDELIRRGLVVDRISEEYANRIKQHPPGSQSSTLPPKR